MAMKFVMGNEAIGLGAIRAGVRVVTGYPGTPSTEVLETIAKQNDGSIHVEWSVNEKAALEVAAGAAYTGARTMVTMKQVGLNVASDPLMSLAYIGVKGGMVLMVADDPGPISSQTEQDTRHFGRFSKLPVFDPVSPEEAYEMIADAFDYSEKYHTPVIFRPTTRVCHGCVNLELKEKLEVPEPEGFVKDSSKWVIFPRLSYNQHKRMEERNNQILPADFSTYRFNKIEDLGSGKKGIITGGVNYTYVKEALAEQSAPIFKVATPFPFPEKQALEFLSQLDEVIAVEELDPVLERELIYICGKHHLNVNIYGKLSGHVANAGENTVESVQEVLGKFLSRDLGANETTETDDRTEAGSTAEQMPQLPIRPPVLCAGCPHRASFFAVKEAMKGKKAVFSGDIGCYTLGNAKPLDMVDTCLCMGADVTIAQGLHVIEPDGVNFSFIGDSTFFASGMTGVANAVYNQHDIVLVILDNSTTAMTGHQPHPGTGKTMMGEVVAKIALEPALKALGVVSVETIDPLNLKEAKAAIGRAIDKKGVKAVIFKSPCIALGKPVHKPAEVDKDQCIGCKACITKLGCPALVMDKQGHAKVETSLCYGCNLCTQVCPVDAIKGGAANE